MAYVIREFVSRAIEAEYEVTGFPKIGLDRGRL
jgi:hypothetical protein